MIVRQPTCEDEGEGALGGDGLRGLTGDQPGDLAVGARGRAIRNDTHIGIRLRVVELVRIAVARPLGRGQWRDLRAGWGRWAGAVPVAAAGAFRHRAYLMHVSRGAVVRVRIHETRMFQTGSIKRKALEQKPHRARLHEVRALHRRYARGPPRCGNDVDPGHSRGVGINDAAANVCPH